MQLLHNLPQDRCTAENADVNMPPALTSLVLLHTTYTCAFKPGGRMSHNWPQTQDCKVLMNDNGMQIEGHQVERNHTQDCKVLNE